MRDYVAFLDLAPIRNTIEPGDWPRLRQKVTAIAQQAAGALLGETDTFAMHRGQVCIITFGETTGEIASVNAAAIGHKMVQSLLGETGVGRIALTPKVFLLGDLLNGQASCCKAQGRRRAAPAPRSAAVPESPPAKIDRRKKLLALYRQDAAADITATYHPIWNLESKTVRSFLLVPSCDTGRAPPSTGYDMLPEIQSDADLIDFDLGNIETGLLSLKQAIDDGHEGGIVLPLHFDTVGSNQGRADLMELFPALPAFVRGRLSFALFGIPGGVPQGRLHEIYGILRPMVQDVAAVLEPAKQPGPALWKFVALIQSVGIPRVCIALPAATDGDTFEKAKSICTRAASLNLKVMTFGLQKGNHAHRLSVAGCSDFGGPLFGGPFTAPAEPYTVASDVFEQSR